MERDSSVKTPLAFLPPLSPSEERVLQLLSEGKTPKEISYELKLSQKTVYAHCHNVMLGKGIKVAKRKGEKQ
jgi:DNA-binding CsgD family transcriptional regulator